MKKVLLDDSYAKVIFEEAQVKFATRHDFSKEIQKIKAKLASIQNQIEATTERIAELPKGVEAKSFYDLILKLQEKKLFFESEIQNLKNSQKDQEKPIDFEDFKNFTKGLKALTEKCTDPTEQAAIIRKLVERIEVTPNGIIMHYHVGGIHYARELNDAPIATGSALNTKTKGLVDHTRPFSKSLLKYRVENLAVRCSNSLTNGRECGA